MKAIRTSFTSTNGSTQLVQANGNRVAMIVHPPLVQDANFSIDAGVAAVLKAGIINWGNQFNFPIILDQGNVGDLITQQWNGIGNLGGDTFIIVELIDDGCDY
jgi:hypothetical protein